MHKTIPRVAPTPSAVRAENEDAWRPLVSVIVPMYNEGASADVNLEVICDHMAQMESQYRYELIVVNDGSVDETGAAADRFALDRPNVRVLHHPANRGLGQSLRTGFGAAVGDYVVTLDADLSYGPAHVDAMLAKIRSTNASIVIASPYMDGGRASNIPWLRRTLSRNANRFLGLMVHNKLTTLTGMVRVYDGAFLRSINLREMGADINPKIIHHARILNAPIVEVPAHLCWPAERRTQSRTSYAKLARETLSVLVSGFLMRPFLYFLAPGLALGAMSAYANAWMLVHVFEQYAMLKASGVPFDFDDAVAAAFTHSPHVFIIGGITLILALQLIGMAVISLQNKLQFDELFFMANTLYRTRGDRPEKA
jgi:glycosyltransferase involved in cell wall biosynthesis